LAQQQRKLVRAFGVPDANDEKVHDRIRKIVGQLPTSYQRDFEKTYEHMTNDRFRDYDNRPFPA